VNLESAVQLGNWNVGLGSFGTGEFSSGKRAQKRIGAIRGVDSEGAVSIVFDREQTASVRRLVFVYTTVIKDRALVEVPEPGEWLDVDVVGIIACKCKSQQNG